MLLFLISPNWRIPMKNIKIPVRKVNRTSNPAPILAIGPKIMAVIEVEAEMIK